MEISGERRRHWLEVDFRCDAGVARLGLRGAPQAYQSIVSTKTRRNCATFTAMKTATIPSVRVEPELRAEVESLLGEGETVSEFVEASVRATVLRRRNQAEFITRGLRSLDEARRSADYVEADVVLQTLQRKLDAARTRKRATPK